MGGVVRSEPLVLVVDDEATVRQALERALRLEGFAVATAADGIEALAAVAPKPPAGIVLAGPMPRLAGRARGLPRREFDLLDVFVRHPGQVLSRDQLLSLVWGYTTDVETNVVDVFVGYLRRKLEAGGEPRILPTVRGVGWALRP